MNHNMKLKTRGVSHLIENTKLLDGSDAYRSIVRHCLYSFPVIAGGVST